MIVLTSALVRSRSIAGECREYRRGIDERVSRDRRSVVGRFPSFPEFSACEVIVIGSARFSVFVNDVDHVAFRRPKRSAIFARPTGRNQDCHLDVHLWVSSPSQKKRKRYKRDETCTLHVYLFSLSFPFFGEIMTFFSFSLSPPLFLSFYYTRILLRII